MATINRPKSQRVLNNLQMARLTRGRMIRLLAHSFPPLYRQQDVSLFLCLPECRRIKLTDAKVVGKGGGWGRGQIIHPRGSLAFFRSFNILCPKPYTNQHKINGVQEVRKTHHRYYSDMKKLQNFPPVYQEIWKEIECSRMRKDFLFIWGNKWMFSQMWGTYSIFSPFSSYIYH